MRKQSNIHTTHEVCTAQQLSKTLSSSDLFDRENMRMMRQSTDTHHNAPILTSLSSASLQR